ncbi:hypothetical protein [Arthrobacter rhizosphaerae]|uniref:hypothetical protein n=1 Tax=Arthrobacter rhizosphaerae TaxID=2855490 RepID=UPI001FF576A9|nr:hypothetical protein [Arthrobacter rhizosphaerae]
MWGAPGPGPALLATLAQRVKRFLEKYSGEMFRVDSRELDLPGITTRMRPLVVPLVFLTLAFRGGPQRRCARILA